MIYLHKTVVDGGTKYLSSTVTQTEIKDAIDVILLALEKTPIYHGGDQRVPAKQLMANAEKKLLGRLQAAAIAGLTFTTTLDKSVETSFPNIASNDRLDLLVRLEIVGKPTYNVVIEFDAARADQVAKKFVSRTALLHQENLIYIAYCYPGPKSCDLPEVRKYFGYLNTIAQGMSLRGFYGMLPPSNYHC